MNRIGMTDEHHGLGVRLSASQTGEIGPFRFEGLSRDARRADRLQFAMKKIDEVSFIRSDALALDRVAQERQRVRHVERGAQLFVQLFPSAHKASPGDVCSGAGRGRGPERSVTPNNSS